jgi:hypothetical protein
MSRRVIDTATDYDNNLNIHVTTAGHNCINLGDFLSTVANARQHRQTLAISALVLRCNHEIRDGAAIPQRYP